MVLIDMLCWWYAKGWRMFLMRSKMWFVNVTDFFSMDSLVRTLFKPYRQISAGASANGSLDLKFQMFLDRMISRLVGFVSRLILLFVGALMMVLGGIGCVILIILWPVIPFLPVVGVVMSVIGVGA